MKTKLTSLILVLIITTESCKKSFLEVDNSERVFRETYVKDLSSLQQYLNGAYLYLAKYFEEGMATAYPELIADNLRPLSLSSSLTRMIPHYNWSQISDGNDFQLNVGSQITASAMDPYWRSGYTIIRICNYAIENISRFESENPTKSRDLLGQAIAIRSYVLFKLVNTFAQSYNYTGNASHPGIPYIKASDITKPFTRQSVSEVYTEIIHDLQQSIQLLPAEATDTRRINYNMARALLARVYLYAENYSSAKDLAIEIVNKVPLMEISKGYPDALFKLHEPRQTEVFFQLSPEAETYFLGMSLHSPNHIRFAATNDLADILVENTDDIRKNWIKDTVIDNTVFRMVKKFPKGAAPEVKSLLDPIEIAYYIPIIRSSEMYLTAAEASAKLGDEQTARHYLDAIRKRANPLIASITATGQALIDSIYKERRKELAFEGTRMYDLQRNKLAINRKDVLQGSPSFLPYPSEKAIAPIPSSDVKLSGIPQNKGY